MTVVDTALHDSLRALKLSGMLHTLDARLAQAHAGELGHLDFLQVLCHDEITRRDTMGMATPAAPRPVRTSQPPWKSSTSPPARNSPPRRSATSPRCAGCTPASRSSSTAPSASGKPMSHKPSATSPSAAAPTSGSPKPAAPWPTSPAATPTAPGPAASPNSPDPPLLILDDFAMRELTAQQADDLYELISERAQTRPVTDRHLEPVTRRLVSAVPQPRRRRIPARPAHQHQPPGLHERPQLPPQQTTRPRRLDNHTRPPSRTTPEGHHLGNYVSPDPGELRERRHSAATSPPNRPTRNPRTRPTTRARSPAATSNPSRRGWSRPGPRPPR